MKRQGRRSDISQFRASLAGSRGRLPHLSARARNSKHDACESQRGSFGVWELVLLWDLEVGAWSFSWRANPEKALEFAGRDGVGEGKVAARIELVRHEAHPVARRQRHVGGG